MDYNEFAKKYSPYFRQYFVPLILAVLGLMFLGYGLIGYFGGKKDESFGFAQDRPDILFEAATDSKRQNFKDSSEHSTRNNMKENMIAVDVEGAVEKPGVYRLSSDSRVQDALIFAGGLSGSADREIVAKNINLATKLTDGMKVYIPFQGEGTVILDVGVLTGGKIVNINLASEAELDGLPGIGKTTADKIISNRPYESIEALVEKKIVGQKVFGQIKDKIVAQ